MSNRRFTPPEPSSDTAPAARILTVNGKPLPEGFEHVIPFSATDQGIAERAAKGPVACVQIVADAWDKTLAHRAQAEPWDSYDPLTEAVDQVREPGFSYRLLSDRVIKRRSLRGWKPCAVNGDRVKVGDLFVAKMPTHLKERRDAYYRAIGDEQLANAADNYRLDQEKTVRDGGVVGEAMPLPIGSQVKDSADPSLAASIGVETRRGTAGAEA